MTTSGTTFTLIREYSTMKGCYTIDSENRQTRGLCAQTTANVVACIAISPELHKSRSYILTVTMLRLVVKHR